MDYLETYDFFAFRCLFFLAFLLLAMKLAFEHMYDKFRCLIFQAFYLLWVFYYRMIRWKKRFDALFFRLFYYICIKTSLWNRRQSVSMPFLSGFLFMQDKLELWRDYNEFRCLFFQAFYLLEQVELGAIRPSFDAHYFELFIYNLICCY